MALQCNTYSSPPTNNHHTHHLSARYNVDNAALDKFPAALKARGYIAVEVEVSCQLNDTTPTPSPSHTPSQFAV